ncbi:RNA-binding protein [Nanoarchaeota archaeon NZ13-N]|nr:MAG: RNA-binding protein [Nanoarchaeota archaeon NZ13-N]
MILIPGDPININKNIKVIGDFYRKDDSIFAKTISLFESKNFLMKITPLNGIYIPKKGDSIIGKVIDVYANGWLIDINSPYVGFLLVKDATDRFLDVSKDDLNNILTYGDFVLAKISNVMKNKIINLTMKEKGLGKLDGGVIVSISPKKVPRVIGKNSSMMNTIKSVLNVDMIVGQNGRIWIRGKDRKSELLAIEAIKIIEKQSHRKRLTITIKKFLEKNKNA